MNKKEQIQLLKEKLEKISGKKIILEDAKPLTWDIYDDVSLDDLPEDIATYKFDDIYERDAMPVDDFKFTPKETRFLLKRRDQLFYIETEGYDWARYVTLVIDPNQGVIQEMAYGDQYEPKVLEYIRKKGSEGAVAKELSALFPNQTTSIPVLQRLVKSGKVIRDMSQRPGRWYLPDTTPEDFTPQEKEKKPRKNKKISDDDINTIKSTLKMAFRGFDGFEYDLEKDGTEAEVEFFSGYRGPRTDHGGGEDGDEWMDDYQVAEVRNRAIKTLTPSIKNAKKWLANKKYKIKEFYVEYGEKGHVYIQYTLTK